MADKKRRKKEYDFSLMAFRVVPEATGQIETKLPEKSPKKNNFDAKALGHLGGKKGGATRAKKLTPEQRQEIARKAAKARWSSVGWTKP